MTAVPLPQTKTKRRVLVAQARKGLQHHQDKIAFWDDAGTDPRDRGRNRLEFMAILTALGKLARLENYTENEITHALLDGYRSEGILL